MSGVPERLSDSKRCFRGNGIASAGAHSDAVAKRDAWDSPIGVLPDSLDRYIGATASIPLEVSFGSLLSKIRELC